MALKTISLYAVIGNPIAHSLSPVMHNAAFKAMGMAAGFVAFQVTDAATALAGVRALGIAGLSVTLPHKQSVMDCLDEVAEDARVIGAVNTVVNRRGRLCGYNTDAPGALTALRRKVDPQGRRVLILGAGGAARALVHAVTGSGGRVALVNRGRQRARELARDFAVEVLSLAEIPAFAPEIIINTTSVGMFPEKAQTPLPEEFLQPGMVVMDIVYNPLNTSLLQAAGRRGALIIDGLEMFVAQGALQFELWTGVKAPVAIMRQAVLRALGENCSLQETSSVGN
ncbi:MAG TPA: shikimate dehydrogenase [Proteobacteria bacterium]|nr:shikimate dehydrogenase [Pseudomonadota bacterium]